MKFTSLDERAVSTVIGFLLIFSAVVSVTGYLVAAKGRVAQQRAEGLVDVMDKAQQRQGQLVGLSYSNQPSTDTLDVYLSNYGWQDVVIENVEGSKALWVSGEQITDDADISIVDPVTGDDLGYKILRRGYVRVRIDNLSSYGLPSSADNYAFTFLAETDIVFSWEVHP